MLIGNSSYAQGESARQRWSGQEQRQQKDIHKQPREVAVLVRVLARVLPSDQETIPRRRQRAADVAVLRQSRRGGLHADRTGSDGPGTGSVQVSHQSHLGDTLRHSGEDNHKINQSSIIHTKSPHKKTTHLCIKCCEVRGGGGASLFVGAAHVHGPRRRLRLQLQRATGQG